MITQVKIHTIGTISEARAYDGLETEAQPQRLHEKHPVTDGGIVRSVQRCAEAYRNAKPTRDYFFSVTKMVLAYNFLASQRVIIKGRTAA
jgi:hypothetical protein